MSFKNIHLPGVVLTDLYKDLVVADESSQQPQSAMAGSGVRSARVEQIENGKSAAGTSEKIAVAQDTNAAPSARDSEMYKILGNNRRKVTVIVHYPQEAFIAEDDLQVLTKILGACKLNLGDIALINTATVAADIEKVKIQLQPEKVLLFGVSPSEIGLPISFPEYKQQNFAGTVFVSAPSITRMNGETDENKLIKRKLWECLKPLFT